MQEHILTLYLPLIISNILHMFVVKHDYLRFLKIPLSIKAFGKNKTYRGFVFVTLLNGFILYICTKVFQIELTTNAFFFGLVLGLTYILFELPNSFLKRRLGIAPGEKSKKFKLLFIFLDRCDSAFGVSLVYSLLAHIEFSEFIMLFALAFAFHFFFSFLLYQLGIKESL